MRGMRGRIAARLTLGVLVLGPAWGCGDGKPSVDTSRNEAKVSGTVRVKGKPAEGGTILFNASNSERIAPVVAGTIGKDGTYSVTTYTGGNQVSFDGEVAAKNRGVGLIKKFVDVKSGENTADFDLMGEGDGEERVQFKLPMKGQARGRTTP